MKSLKYIFLTLTIVLSTGLIAQNHYHFTSDQASIKWTGKKIGGSHWGYIKLKKGSLDMENMTIKKGSFTIDMTSISVKDIESESYNKKLVDHLKSDDFFGVKDYPEAILEITESTPFVNKEATIKGNLTIKGITNPIEFKTVYGDGKLTATIVVDRSKYNVRYGSKSFFNNIGDKMIYDEFTLDVILKLETE